MLALLQKAIKSKETQLKRKMTSPQFPPVDDLPPIFLNFRNRLPALLYSLRDKGVVEAHYPHDVDRAVRHAMALVGEGRGGGDAQQICDSMMMKFVQRFGKPEPAQVPIFAPLTRGTTERFIPPREHFHNDIHIRAAHDESGLFVYQAFNEEIATAALETGRLDASPNFNRKRFTWFKPSFAWMLARSRYGTKCNQTRVLRIKLPHEAFAQILSNAQLVLTTKASGAREARAGGKRGGKTESRNRAVNRDDDNDGDDDDDDDSGSSSDRGEEVDDDYDDNDNERRPRVGSGPARTVVQWDPERDVMSSTDGKEPRKLLRSRAIQIGVAGGHSTFFVSSATSIEDVTPLAAQIRLAHMQKKTKDMEAALDKIKSLLPLEKPYFPVSCSREVLLNLGLLPGAAQLAIAQMGRGKVGACE